MAEFSKPERDCKNDIPRDQLIRNREWRFLFRHWPSWLSPPPPPQNRSLRQNLDIRISSGISDVIQDGDLGTWKCMCTEIRRGDDGRI